MKHFVLPVALILSACVSSAYKQTVLQDQQNTNKFNELKTKIEIPTDCEKIGKLYDFKQLKSPTIDDLAKIMPVFGLKEQDAADIDKVYGIDFSSIKHYKCDNTDNTDKLKIEAKEYCNSKYQKGSYEQEYCEQYLNRAIFNNDKYRHNKEIQEVISNYGSSYMFTYIEEDIKDKIEEIHPLPDHDHTEKFLQEFKPSELIKAKKEVLGIYDGICSWPLCEHWETHEVTRLNAVMVLDLFCTSFFGYLGDQSECACYTHQTYKKVNYKNLIYIEEQRKLPSSKKTEFDLIFKKCKQKLEKQRYGEMGNY